MQFARRNEFPQVATTECNHFMGIFLIALAAFVFTYLGGYFATKIKDGKHLLLAFSAGTILAVALFDLLPESFELLQNLNTVTVLLIIGFSVYFLLNNRFAVTAHKENDICHNDSHHHHHNFNIWSLIFHSFFDGLAIGFAFQVSPMVGFTVALGVLAHRFSDGVNTVTFSLRNGETTVWKWVHINAIAPVVGIMIGSFINIPNQILGGILAFFAGLFLYIGASDLVPECHHDHPKFMTGVSFLIGCTFIWGIVNFAHVH